VVKIGTASITDDYLLSERKMGRIASQIAQLRREGKEVIIVSSGAIAAGIKKLHLTQRPRDINALQATAAVGQGELMKAYASEFERSGMNVAQILLTRDDFRSRARFLKIRNTIVTLLKMDAIPVINENDSIAVEEIKFGDNDTLSAIVASNIDADLLVLMSSTDGLYTKDPAREKGAQKIDVVHKITEDITALRGKSRLGGVGGISSKVSAGKMMMECGIPMAIVDSNMEDVLPRLMAGESVGTVFLPNKRLENRLQWMLYASNTKGSLTVDDGAARILAKGMVSLLPSGITRVKGTFKKGDPVTIVDATGGEIARGMVNYPSDDLTRIIGRHTSEIQTILDRKAPKEIIHHDNMVLL